MTYLSLRLACIMRADRLLAILLELQARGKSTSRKLARKLEVSTRTIHRDMEALSMAGVPVYALRGPDGGWELAEGYRTNLTGMKRAEILSLIFMTAASPGTTPAYRKHFEAALTRLLAALPPAYRRDAELARERIHVDGASWHPRGSGSSEDDLPHLPLLQEAVWSDRKTRIQYDGRDESRDRAGKSARARTIHPLGLVVKGRIWYLVAWTREGYRTFRASRIRSVTVTEQTFVRPRDFDLAKHWQAALHDFRAAVPRYRVLVTIRADWYARMALRPFAHAIGEPRPAARPARKAPEGAARTGVRPPDARAEWLDCELDFETRDWAVMMLAGAGDNVIAREPAELRVALREAGERLVQTYGCD